MDSRALNFIQKAKAKHNSKYDYSKVNYVNYRTKVKIICPKHGDFEQTPKDHLRGGCSKCGIETAGNNRRKNKDKFTQQARSVHGDKYDYSKVVYVKAIEKVIIICPKHGEFMQEPTSHLSGHGCPTCVGQNKNSQIFVEQAKEVHRDKYDYSKVVYVKAREKIIIICSKHGEFMQSPRDHLDGRGCKKCALERPLRFSHEEFMTKIKAKHGDKYDYSKTKYVGSEKKMTIICKLHGEFLQRAGNHLSGHGCPICFGNEKITTEVFIERARQNMGKNMIIRE
jgi:hypothetical protein